MLGAESPDPLLEHAMASINQQLESLRAQLAFAFHTPTLYSTHRSFPQLHTPSPWSSTPSLSLLTPLTRYGGGGEHSTPGISKYDAPAQKLRWRLEEQERRLRQQMGSFNSLSMPTYSNDRHQAPVSPHWQQHFAHLQTQFDMLSQRLDASPLVSSSRAGVELASAAPRASPTDVGPETDSEIDLTNAAPMSNFDVMYDGGFHPNYWKAKYRSAC